MFYGIAGVGSDGVPAAAAAAGGPTVIDWSSAPETDPNNAVTFTKAETVSATLNGTTHTMGASTQAYLAYTLPTVVTPGDGFRLIVEVLSSSGLVTGHGLGVGLGSSASNAVYGSMYNTAGGWSASLATLGNNLPAVDGLGRSAATPGKIVFCMSLSNDNGNYKAGRDVTLLDSDSAELGSGVAHSIVPWGMTTLTNLDTVYLFSHDQVGTAAFWSVRVSYQHSNNAI